MLALVLTVMGGWQTVYQAQQSCNGNSCSMVQVWVPDPPRYQYIPQTAPSPQRRSPEPEKVSFRFY